MKIVWHSRIIFHGSLLPSILTDIYNDLWVKCVCVDSCRLLIKDFPSWVRNSLKLRVYGFVKLLPFTTLWTTDVTSLRYLLLGRVRVRAGRHSLRRVVPSISFELYFSVIFIVESLTSYYEVSLFLILVRNSL